MATNLDKAITIGRDLILFAFGLVGIAYQQLTGNVNFILLAIFTGMTGVPGLTHLIGLTRGQLTESQSSSSVSEEHHSELDNS